MDDEYGGDDVDFGAALAVADRAANTARPPHASTSASASVSTSVTHAANTPRPVQQPKPQSLGPRAAASSILVSPRQKGNPILNNIRSMPWEYSDIPADFVLGATTCALFLSLKYHRLHPEYIYSRIRVLAGKYLLRIVLVMVDIDNHENSLKELSKTSLINNVTIILTWSAQEAGRYLELFKSCEHAAPTGIKAQQSLSYSDKLVEFVTVPRSINKTDAVGLVSNFGSLRTAVNAMPEDISLIAGWGEKKVQTWSRAVRDPFRVAKAKKGGLSRENTRPSLSRDQSQAEDELDAQVAARLGIGSTVPFTAELATPARRLDSNPDAGPSSETALADTYDPDEEEAMAMAEFTAVEAFGKSQTHPDPEIGRPRDGETVADDKARANVQQPVPASTMKRKHVDNDLSEGVMAALNKLRKT